MIGIEDARAIVYGVDAERAARLAWRAAYADGAYRDAVVMLHLETGYMYAVAPVALDDEPLPGEIVVGWISAERRRISESMFGSASAVSPSREVIEETAARHARRRWLSEEHWRLIDRQLQTLYGRRRVA